MDIENGHSYNETKMDILRLKLVVKWTLGHWEWIFGQWDKIGQSDRLIAYSQGFIECLITGGHWEPTHRSHSVATHGGGGHWALNHGGSFSSYSQGRGSFSA